MLRCETNQDWSSSAASGRSCRSGARVAPGVKGPSGDSCSGHWPGEPEIDIRPERPSWSGEVR